MDVRKWRNNILDVISCNKNIDLKELGNVYKK
jgi:hypothetical protein